MHVLMITPVSTDGIRLDFSSVPVLAELCTWICLEGDHIRTAPVVETKWFHPDRACPMVPACVVLIVDIHIWCSHVGGNSEFFELIVLNTVDRVIGCTWDGELRDNRWQSHVNRRSHGQ